MNFDPQYTQRTEHNEHFKQEHKILPAVPHILKNHVPIYIQRTNAVSKTLKNKCPSFHRSWNSGTDLQPAIHGPCFYKLKI